MPNVPENFPAQLPPGQNLAADLYLDLLKRSLSGLLRPQLFVEDTPPQSPVKAAVYQAMATKLAETGRVIARRVPYDYDLRSTGRECWPPEAESMVGLARLDNVQQCVEGAIRDKVPGDVIETGVWRGGVTILMKAVLEAYGEGHRSVWVADSFAGLPPPNPELYPLDAGDMHYTYPLAVSDDQVRENFRRYRLLDSRIKFLKGWFKDTLPGAPIEKLAVMRLDGDMYESTSDAIRALYPKLSIGGYCIVDDYLWHPPCAQAVEDYRREHGITETIHKVDFTGVYWRRER